MNTVHIQYCIMSLQRSVYVIFFCLFLTFGPGMPTPSNPGSPGSPGKPGGPSEQVMVCVSCTLIVIKGQMLIFLHKTSLHHWSWISFPFGTEWTWKSWITSVTLTEKSAFIPCKTYSNVKGNKLCNLFFFFFF